MPSSKEEQGEILLYEPKGWKTEIQVNLKEQTVWLNVNQIAELFGRNKSVISRHLRNIYKARELTKKATVAKNATVQSESRREVISMVFFCFFAIKPSCSSFRLLHSVTLLLMSCRCRKGYFSEGGYPE